MLAGGFVALGFQSYMIEAWAVWPALGLAYLFVTGKKVWRRVVDVVAAGLTSTALSLAWVIVVWLVPASQRPYIGGTLSNNPWEMVFGYNALGRFSATQGVGDYESFTPPYSGNPGLFRLFNAQVGSQIAWLIPAAVVAIIALAILRFRVGVLVFLAGWFVTLCAMFSLVAGMHQFYTSALAVPIALLVALAFALARQKQSLWPQLALLGSAVVMACVLAVRTPSYLEWAVPAQLVCAVGAAALIIAADQGWRPARMAWVALPIIAGLTLTPVAWSIDTINHPNSINPVAGDGSAVGFGGGFGAGFGAARPGTNNGSRAGTPFGGGLSSPPTAQGGGAGGSSSQSLLSYVTENRDGASYLLAVFGAQNAATYITATGGQEILPIGGFTGVDQVPTLEQFQELVSSGQLHFVQTSGGSFNRNSSAANTATPVSQQISAWVTSSCTAVSGMSSLYRCG
jgi:4-amino-4-deoxy-L-arabinose transferase-like glycosyltransferase